MHQAMFLTTDTTQSQTDWLLDLPEDLQLLMIDAILKNWFFPHT